MKKRKFAMQIKLKEKARYRREKNASVKIWKLEHNNRYTALFDRDSDESDIDES